MLIFVVLIALSYASLMIALKKGWSRLETPLYDYETPENRFSIVIPFRNEAENLPELLESLLLLNYPLELFEIFLVNDDSADDSEKIISEFNKPNLDQGNTKKTKSSDKNKAKPKKISKK